MKEWKLTEDHKEQGGTERMEWKTHPIHGYRTLAVATCGSVTAVRELNVDGGPIVPDDKTGKEVK